MKENAGKEEVETVIKDIIKNQYQVMILYGDFINYFLKKYIFFNF